MQLAVVRHHRGRAGLWGDPLMAGERAVVTPEDHAAALALVSDWAERQVVPAHTTAELLELVGMVAAALADSRHRQLPGDHQGKRHQVDQVLNVHRRQWTAELRLRHEREVRRAWAAGLAEQGLRPLTWPPIIVEHLAYESVAFVGPDGSPVRWRQVPPGHPDVEVVRLTISGTAVAE